MRIFALLVAALLAGSVFASDIEEARYRMDSAFLELRDRDQLAMVLVGRHESPQASFDYRVDLAWRTWFDGERPWAQIDLRVTRDDALVAWQVMDGTTFWDYDPRSNRYAAIPVGTFEGHPGPDYLNRMVRLAVARSPREARFVADVLRTIVDDRRAWAPFYPNATVSVGEAGVWVGLEGMRNASLSYLLSEGAFEGEWVLEGVSSIDEQRLPSGERVQTWELAILRGPFEGSPTFTFVPPAGSVAVPLDRADRVIR